METNRLRQFRVVCETKNLRKAAELLGMSHSALSKSIKVLEEQLKIDLLLQTGRNIEITEEGKSLLPRLIAFLEAEGTLVPTRQASASTLRIGTFEVFSTYLLGSRWRQYFPDLNLDLRELTPGSLEDGLVKEEIDAGISYEPIPRSELDFIYLGKVEMGVYVRRGSFEKLELSEIPFAAPISPIKEIPTGTKGLDGWPDHEFKRNIHFHVDMMESGLNLARTGDAAIFIPEFIARIHNEFMKPDFALVKFPTKAKIRSVFRKVYLLKRKSSREEKNIRRLATMIRNECFDQ